MKYSKKFSYLFYVLLILLLVGCSKASGLNVKDMDIDFPVDDEGYLEYDIVMINGKSHPLEITGGSHINSNVDSEINFKIDDNSDVLEVILPQYLPINYWTIEEREYVDLISYNKFDLGIKDEDMIEGISKTVQKFDFYIGPDEDKEFLLKWSNIEELEKPFKDQKEDYLLKIIVSH